MEKHCHIFNTRKFYTSEYNSLMPQFTGTSKYKYKLKIKFIACIQSIEKNSYKEFIYTLICINILFKSKKV